MAITAVSKTAILGSNPSSPASRKEIKEQIIKRIKEEGITVSTAAADAGISTKIINMWYYSGGRDANCAHRKQVF